MQAATTFAAVSRSPAATKAVAVGATAAHELNDELTIILGSVEFLLQRGGDPAGRALLIDVRSAAHRCAGKTRRLLEYGRARRQGPVNAPLEKLVDL